MSRTRFTVTVVCFLILFVSSAFAQTGSQTANTASGNQVAKGVTPKASTPPVSKPDTSLVDLNSASKKLLMTLPGINDASAQKIIDNRPYKSKNDLTQKKVLSADAYAKIASRIVLKTTTRVSPGNVEKKAASSSGTKEVKKYQ